MYSFDASSVIYAWQTYPICNEHFESLWTWIGEGIHNTDFSISDTAFNEINAKIPEFSE